ncbi:unnamed protein product, partial [Oppiella nova]
WFVLLFLVINAFIAGKQEIVLFEGVVVITISIIGLMAVLKEWYDLSLAYAILEAVFLIVLIVLLALFVSDILFLSITIAIQTSITILAFGFAVAVKENNKIDRIKIQHNFV